MKSEKNFLKRISLLESRLGGKTGETPEQVLRRLGFHSATDDIERGIPFRVAVIDQNRVKSWQK